MFSETDIVNLYNTKIKLPTSYFKKYENLPKCPVKSWVLARKYLNIIGVYM